VIVLAPQAAVHRGTIRIPQAGVKVKTDPMIAAIALAAFAGGKQQVHLRSSPTNAH
jgi:hypothetical protein